MLLNWVGDPKKAAVMSENIMKIMMRSFTPDGCTILLENGDIIKKAHIVGSKSGNNGGKNGTWLYYGEVTVEAEDGQVFSIDASMVKSVN